MTTSHSKPTKVLLATLITFFLLLLNKVNSLNDLSFTKTKFSPNGKDLIFERDAFVSAEGVLYVTQVKSPPPTISLGRARYSAPLQIWDKITGKVASFTTSFSFVLTTPDVSLAADGLAFFLAPPDSQIPQGSHGGHLALFNTTNYDPSIQTVAVEFDTYVNSNYDPNFTHIGVDVNTIQSIKTVKWEKRYDEVANVFITYQASTKTLTASLTYPSDKTSYIVSASVDVKAILPEWVRVGFSAASGSHFERYGVHDWSFTSTFDKNYAAVEDNVRSIRYTAA